MYFSKRTHLAGGFGDKHRCCFWSLAERHDRPEAAYCGTNTVFQKQGRFYAAVLSDIDNTTMFRGIHVPSINGRYSIFVRTEN